MKQILEPSLPVSVCGVYVCGKMCVCVYVCMCACMYLCICVYVQAFLCANVCMCECVYVCVCERELTACMCMCVCVCARARKVYWCVRDVLYTSVCVCI